jgi:hypothetical protein
MNRLAVIASALILCAACGTKEETPSPTPAPAPTKPTAGGDTTATQAPAAPAAPANAGPAPSKDKEMLGLDLQPMGDWKPEWDPDAKVAKWTRDESLVSIVNRIVSEELDDIEDLKREAPMMMQLGEAINEVVETKPASKGWYAVVKRGEKNVTDFVYVQKYGDTTLVCSAVLGNLGDEGKPITQEEAFKACDSIKVKP